MLILLLLAQAATLPDIQLDARVQARSLTIEKQGEASLTLRAAPDGGAIVQVEAPKANGRKTIRDLDVTVHGAASIADPLQNLEDAATPPAE